MTLTCHLHIGMPKTGTSAIQEAFQRNLRGPFTYLSLGSSNQSGAFVTMFEDHPERHMSNRILGRCKAETRLRRRRLRGKMNEFLRNAAMSNNISDVMFSAERMSAPRDFHAVKRMKQFLSNYCSDFRVYAYLRPPRAFITSAFQQQIRLGGGNLDLELGQILPRYRARFEPFDQFFGPEAVSLRLYDRQRLRGGDVVQDFKSQLGIAQKWGGSQPVNRALCLDAVAILWAIHRSGRLCQMGATGLRLSQDISDILTNLRGPRFRFSDDLLSATLDHAGKDIEWAENRLEDSFNDSSATGGIQISGIRDMAEAAISARARLPEISKDLAIRGLKDPIGTSITSTRLASWVNEGLRG
jgi:hypothetical protein